MRRAKPSSPSSADLASRGPLRPASMAVLLDPSSEWSSHVEALHELTTLTRSLSSRGPSPELDALLAQIRLFAPKLPGLIADLRSILVKETCEALHTLAAQLGSPFVALVDIHVIPALLKRVCTTKAVIRDSALSAAEAMFTHGLSAVTPYVISHLAQTVVARKAPPAMRSAAATFIGMILEHPLLPTNAALREALESAIVAGVADSDESVRAISRRNWVAYVGSNQDAAAVLLDRVPLNVAHRMISESNTEPDTLSSLHRSPSSSPSKPQLPSRGPKRVDPADRITTHSSPPRALRPLVSRAARASLAPNALSALRVDRAPSRVARASLAPDAVSTFRADSLSSRPTQVSPVDMTSSSTRAVPPSRSVRHTASDIHAASGNSSASQPNPKKAHLAPARRPSRPPRRSMAPGIAINPGVSSTRSKPALPAGLPVAPSAASKKSTASKAETSSPKSLEMTVSDPEKSPITNTTTKAKDITTTERNDVQQEQVGSPASAPSSTTPSPKVGAMKLANAPENAEGTDVGFDRNPQNPVIVSDDLTSVPSLPKKHTIENSSMGNDDRVLRDPQAVVSSSDDPKETTESATEPVNAEVKQSEGNAVVSKDVASVPSSPEKQATDLPVNISNESEDAAAPVSTPEKPSTESPTRKLRLSFIIGDNKTPCKKRGISAPNFEFDDDDETVADDDEMKGDVELYEKAKIVAQDVIIKKEEELVLIKKMEDEEVAVPEQGQVSYSKQVFNVPDNTNDQKTSFPSSTNKEIDTRPAFIKPEPLKMEMNEMVPGNEPTEEKSVSFCLDDPEPVSSPEAEPPKDSEIDSDISISDGKSILPPSVGNDSSVQLQGMSDELTRATNAQVKPSDFSTNQYTSEAKSYSAGRNAGTEECVPSVNVSCVSHASSSVIHAHSMTNDPIKKKEAVSMGKTLAVPLGCATHSAEPKDDKATARKDVGSASDVVATTKPGSTVDVAATSKSTAGTADIPKNDMMKSSLVSKTKGAPTARGGVSRRMTRRSVMPPKQVRASIAPSKSTVQMRASIAVSKPASRVGATAPKASASISKMFGGISKGSSPPLKQVRGIVRSTSATSKTTGASVVALSVEEAKAGSSSFAPTTRKFVPRAGREAGKGPKSTRPTSQASRTKSLLTRPTAPVPRSMGQSRKVRSESSAMENLRSSVTTLRGLSGRSKGAWNARLEGVNGVTEALKGLQGERVCGSVAEECVCLIGEALNDVHHRVVMAALDGMFFVLLCTVGADGAGRLQKVFEKRPDILRRVLQLMRDGREDVRLAGGRVMQSFEVQFSAEVQVTLVLRTMGGEPGKPRGGAGLSGVDVKVGEMGCAALVRAFERAERCEEGFVWQPGTLETIVTGMGALVKDRRVVVRRGADAVVKAVRHCLPERAFEIACRRFGATALL